MIFKDIKIVLFIIFFAQKILNIFVVYLEIAEVKFIVIFEKVVDEMISTKVCETFVLGAKRL